MDNDIVRKCLDCGSDEVFIQINGDDVDNPLYRCFDCYCEDYENYMSNDNY